MTPETMLQLAIAVLLLPLASFTVLIFVGKRLCYFNGIFRRYKEFSLHTGIRDRHFLFGKPE